MLLLCALVGSIPSVWADTYTKITSASDLEVGAEYLIVNTAGTYAAGATSTTSTKYATTVAVTVSGSTITNPNSNVAVYTLGGNATDGWTFYSSKDSKYLYWTSGNSLNVNASVSNNSRWGVTISNGSATISNKATTTRIIRFNSDRFACYTSTTGTLVSLYKKQTTVAGTTAAPTISGATPFVGTATVTITNNSSADGASIYYTLDGSDPTTTTSSTADTSGTCPTYSTKSRNSSSR